MNPSINTILEGNETVSWQGSISRGPLTFIAIIMIVITGAISGYLFSQPIINYTFNGGPAQISGSFVGLIVLVIGLLIMVFYLWTNLVKEYAITSKRVVIKSGIIGTDFKSIYFNEIKAAVVDVGLIGKIFSVGTIKIDTGKTETYSSGSQQTGSNQVRTRTMYDFLLYIDKPYDVYKTIQGSLTDRVEGLYSGRADREAHPGL